MPFINSIKAFIFYSIILVSAFFTLVFAYTPAASTIFINRRVHFRLCSFIMGYFLLMTTCLLEDFLDIKIVITGDQLTKKKNRALAILNHRTRLDWMYTWMLYSRFELLEKLKVTLKAELRSVPGIGWGCYQGRFLFLQRDWEKDKDEIKNTIEYYKSCQSPVSLLVFPEGTNFSDKAKTKSNDYASKQEAYNKPYEFCLHPHVTGFTYLLSIMRSNDIIDTVNDITIGYEGQFPISEFDLLKGYFPKIVHFHIKRYNAHDLPTEDKSADRWLQKCWDEKENRLNEFYRQNQFERSSKQFNNQHIESNVRFQRRLTLISFTLFVLFWSYGFYASTSIKVYVLIIVVFHLLMAKYRNSINGFFVWPYSSDQRDQGAIKQD